MTPLAVTIACLLAFLVGSVPTGYLIARSKGIDIRKHGSGNIGATNVGRVLGKKLGLVCFALDVLKGLVPTLVMGIVLGTLGSLDVAPSDAWAWLGVMAMTVLGHLFTPWLGFKGGKGVATSLGALLGVAPALALPCMLAFAVWIGSLRVWAMVGLSSVLAACCLPIGVALLFVLTGRIEAMVPFLVITLALAALVIVKHRSNLRRIAQGTEPRVSWLGRKPNTSA